MGYETTLQTLLNGMGLSSYGATVTGCTKTNGTSVDVEYIEETNPMDFKFTVVGEGESLFTISTSIMPVPITINVAKMTPAAE